MLLTRLISGFAVLASVASVHAEDLRGADSVDRPNFLVVLADDLGYGDLACYGHPTIKTPNLDQFAGQSLRLTDCYSAAANCSPARAGLMTGRTPTRVGVHNWIPMLSPMHVPRSEITIATLLRQAGYATAHVGKWHLNGRFNLVGQPHPPDHGFDHWFSTQNNALPTHHNPDNFVRNGKPVGRIEGYSGPIVAGEAIHWLTDGRDKKKPFFLFVCFHEPHEPIASDHRFTGMYSDKGMRSRFDPEVSSLAAHHGNVTQLDHAFGVLMKALDEQGLSENTVVWFTSDNGPAITNAHPHGSAGRLRDKKGTMYEGGIRVPGMIRWPGETKPGTVSDEPVSGVDVLPTLCAAVEIPLPTDRPIDGTNVLPLFEGKSIERSTPLYWHFNFARRAPKVVIRVGDWKLLATLTGKEAKPGLNITAAEQKGLHTAKLDRFELYNLRKDVEETADLSEDEPGKLKELTAKMRTMYADVVVDSPTWPAWESPGYEGRRIRAFLNSLKQPGSPPSD